jgi:hypothetical protein
LPAARFSARIDPRFPFDGAGLMAKHGLMGFTLPQSEGRAEQNAHGRDVAIRR